MSGPVNVLRTPAGKLQPVCEFCGELGPAVEPDHTGRLHVWDLARGWSVAPYPPDYEHDDGTAGDLFECGDCRKRLEAGEGLTPTPDRMAARRARGRAGVGNPTPESAPSAVTPDDVAPRVWGLTTTDRDVRNYVLAALGEYADEHDVDGIVSDVLASEWSPVPNRPVTVLDAMPTFWEVVQRWAR